MPPAIEHADQIVAAFAVLQIDLTPRQADHLGLYLAELKRWSARMNLTRFTTTREIIQEHFIDSAMGLPLIPPDHQDAIDLGTGAGFPGLVIKILRPEITLRLVESVQKKASFLNAITGRLRLPDVVVLAQRAEAAATRPELRGRLSVVTARALAKPDAALALCRPFCSPAGRILLYLSARAQPVWPTDLAVIDERRYRLPGHRDDRIVVALAKTG
jgi:16S rRNA (guanine527-N7)-methyltransferase